MAGETAYYDIRIRVFDRPLDELERKTDRFERKVGGLGRAFAGAFAATAVITGVTLLTKKIVGLGAEMEQTRVSFTTMLGSAQKANETLRELNKFATITPFRQGEVVQGARQMLAYGFTAESLTDNLRTLGDVSSGLSIPLGDLVYLYGTVRTQGRAMTKDIMQFANRGIPIYAELNKVTGKYGQSLQKAIEDGEITFEVIEKAFKSMTAEGSMFGGLMEKQSKTLAGRWSTFLDVLENTGRNLGEKLNPSLGRTLDIFADLIKVNPPIIDHFFQQRDAFKSQSDELKSLLPRYEELNAKSNKSISEQNDLNEVIKKIVTIVPSAATAFDRYGNAIGISTEKIKSFIDFNKDAIKILNADAIKEASFQMDRLASQTLQNKNFIESLNNAAPTPGIIKTLSEKQSLQSGLMGQGGLIEMKMKELEALGGKMSEFAAKRLADAGYFGKGVVGPTPYTPPVPFKIQSTNTAKTGNASGESTKAGVEKISSATRNVTLNITKLIENLNFTKDPAKNEYDMEEMVKRVLLRAVNDVNLVQ